MFGKPRSQPLPNIDAAVCERYGRLPPSRSFLMRTTPQANTNAHCRHKYAIPAAHIRPTTTIGQVRFQVSSQVSNSLGLDSTQQSPQSSPKTGLPPPSEQYHEGPQNLDSASSAPRTPSSFQERFSSFLQAPATPLPLRANLFLDRLLKTESLQPRKLSATLRGKMKVNRETSNVFCKFSSTSVVVNPVWAKEEEVPSRDFMN